MPIEFGLTDECINTKYAPLAALSVLYQHERRLQPLDSVEIAMKTRDFTPIDKLCQVLISILAGCETISEVNTRLKPEVGLAQIWHWDRFADQSCLSETLDALTQMNIDQLRGAVTDIWHSQSRIVHHDWRGHLYLDFDLSGLPCGKQAEKSQKGYFSGKKTSPVANWPVSVALNTEKRSGQDSIQATVTRSVASVRQCWQPKVH